MMTPGLARPIYPPTRSPSLYAPAHGPIAPRSDPAGRARSNDGAYSPLQSPTIAPSYRSRQPSLGTTKPEGLPENTHQAFLASTSEQPSCFSSSAPANSAIPFPLASPSSQWSISQEKAILTTLTILASLLAGTSTSLLSFYRNSKHAPEIVSALTYAAIGLEIWGSVVAAATMIIAISLEAACVEREAHRHHKGKAVYQGASEEAGVQATYAPLRASYLRQNEATRLSPLTLKVLDNLTLTCGYLIPFAALLELIALVAYAYSLLEQRAGIKDEAVAITLALTMGVGTTLAAIASAYWRRSDNRKTQASPRRGEQQQQGGDQEEWVWLREAEEGRESSLRPPSITI
ncbi:hypothetical protein BCV69DRAFT_142962 [Microstroma glucosiphilum]|uniref:Uncharacterized protein n=1 Tax=Pseudomicrostroma glucosiphilum TaxID=1684307 RepID=A0A316UB68_9BASI|nr:hypothetical protein BCV69DRAFT_142962 [Pseudomicrostroma glucosiphilum]PWN22409.1 hypothetical protein BCV69DRAFT_142962 [Pseudomicrostroma glucosiphilum]